MLCIVRRPRSRVAATQAAALVLSCRRHYAAVTTTSTLPQPGDHLHGFEVKRRKDIAELDLTALELSHDKTGAEYLHIARNDKNNVFSIGFKTNPPDHTGVPHILEHLVLCGSERYPVRDPFFKMMPRSLQNFMNAMTYSDHTVYPFATTNAQDFRNLMSVYLDATLHPLLKPQDFAQEGWRIGPENVNGLHSDSSSDADKVALMFKGVVYNEMKGSMSSADNLFHTLWQNHIFPSIQNSGGMPSAMTSLTYPQLKQFHEEHYHPSNSKLFTYGDIPLAQHLSELGPQLDRFERRKIDSEPRLPVSISGGDQTFTVQGPLDPMFSPTEQYKASLSLLMCDTSDVLETFSLSMIASLLLDGFSAPLYQSTIEIGMGATYTPNTGLDTSGKIAIFSLGLSGMKQNSIVDLENSLRNTLLAVKRKGFDMQKVEGNLHQIELSMKHRTAHFGMAMMSRLQDGWFNDVDPMSTVDPAQTIELFRERLQSSDYLESLLEKYWLSGPIYKFIMEPCTEYEAGLRVEESSRLKQKIQDLSSNFESPEQARQSLEHQEMDLQIMQETAKNENIDCLPTLRITDIPRQGERKDVRFSSVGETKVQWRENATNGITYFKGIYTLKDLPDDLRPYLPLFSSALQRLGTQELNVEALEDAIKLKTGGIDLGYHSATSPFDIDKCEEGILYSSHALDRNVPSMFELLQTMILNTAFDKHGAEEKIAELIKGFASNALDDIADAGTTYAQHFAEAGLSPQARLTETVSGLTQVKLMMDLAAHAGQGRLGDVIDKLKRIQCIAVGGAGALRVALTCGQESSSANEAALQKFLSTLPTPSLSTSAPSSTSQTSFSRNSKSFFPLPYQVYYSALARRTVPYTHKDSAPLRVLAELLTHKRIHHEIREKGGAYGGSAYAAALRGIFGFSSYRDPNPVNSLKVMQEAGVWARDRQFTDRELEEAKLSIFQGFDAPQSVNSEGMNLFMTGISDGMRQKQREQLLDVSAKDVNEVANTYLVESQADTNIALLGKPQEWTSQNAGWTAIPMNLSRGDMAPAEEPQEAERIPEFEAGPKETQDGYLVI